MNINKSIKRASHRAARRSGYHLNTVITVPRVEPKQLDVVFKAPKPFMSILLREPQRDGNIRYIPCCA